MKKKEYVLPKTRELSLRLQSNAMSPASVNSIYDDGLPSLNSDSSTLDWIEQ